MVIGLLGTTGVEVIIFVIFAVQKMLRKVKIVILGVRACLKNHSRNLHAPTLRDISPEFSCRSPLRRPHPGKISHKVHSQKHKIFSFIYGILITVSFVLSNADLSMAFSSGA